MKKQDKLKIKNNNGKVLRKLTIRSLKTGKMRNFFIILTVALSVALLTGMSFMYISSSQYEQQLIDTMQHVIFMKVDNSKVDDILTDERTSDSLVYKQGIFIEVEDYIIRPLYYSNDSKEIETIKIVEGKYPTEINQVAVDKSYMERIGKDIKLGEKISFTWLDGSTEDFTVCGFTNSENPSKTFGVLFSKNYAENGSQLKDIPYSVAIKIVGARQMSSENFLGAIYEMGFDYGIERPDINPNNKFVQSISLKDTAEVLTITGISIGILLVSILVIYSIFYIFITGKTQQFGQFRTLGMTSKQIKKMINFEGIILCLIGSPIGLLIGGLIAYIIQPNGFSFTSMFAISLVIVLADLITVLISIHKPAKIASTISPIETLKSNGYIEIKTNRVNMKNRKLTPFGLAKISSQINKKKSFMTVVSLGVGGVLFITGTTMLVSINREQYSRQGGYRFGEYILTFSENAINTNEHGETGIQMDNPFNDEFIKNIKSIEGIKDVLSFNNLEVEFDYNNYKTTDSFVPFTHEDLEKLKLYQNTGNFNYDEMVQNKGILITCNNIAKEIYGWKFEIGDKINIRWFDGTQYIEDEFTIMGDLKYTNMAKSDDDYIYSLITSTGWFIVPNEILNNMLPKEFNTNYELIVSSNDYERNSSNIEIELKTLIKDNEKIVMETLAENIVYHENTFKTLYMTILGLSMFIIGFSLINLINTLISNTMVRKQEFAMLRSIGMSSKQLSQMIKYEGIILAIKNVILTIIFGNLSGYALICIFRYLGATYMYYKVPMFYLLVYILLTIIAPILISIVTINMLDKKSLVERLREIE